MRLGFGLTGRRAVALASPSARSFRQIERDFFVSDHPTPTRAIPRQATSAVAHIAPEPEEDDPLLAFAPFIHSHPRRN